MGFWSELGKAAFNGIAEEVESTARKMSRDERYSKEKRAHYRDLAEKSKYRIK